MAFIGFHLVFIDSDMLFIGFNVVINVFYIVAILNAIHGQFMLTLSEQQG